MNDDGVLLISGGLVGVQAEHLTFLVAAPRAQAVAAATATGAGRFEAAVPLRHDPWRFGPTVLRPARTCCSAPRRLLQRRRLTCLFMPNRR